MSSWPKNASAYCEYAMRPFVPGAVACAGAAFTRRPASIVATAKIGTRIAWPRPCCPSIRTRLIPTPLSRGLVADGRTIQAVTLGHTRWEGSRLTPEQRKDSAVGSETDDLVLVRGGDPQHPGPGGDGLSTRGHVHPGRDRPGHGIDAEEGSVVRVHHPDCPFEHGKSGGRATDRHPRGDPIRRRVDSADV